MLHLSDSEVSERGNNSVAAKRHWVDSSPEEKSSLWSSFDEMMGTGEDTDVEITQSHLWKWQLTVTCKNLYNRESLEYWQQKTVLYPIFFGKDSH